MVKVNFPAGSKKDSFSLPVDEYAESNFSANRTKVDATIMKAIVAGKNVSTASP